ncbi:MAG: nucleotidyltransferase domain-containing protein [Candidatus Asgardarchaeum sp.]|nr:nucleotidyltransferase domain-containing protein [Candidatus Odinarchaeota archaeon]
MQEEYLALRWKLLKHRKNVIESRTKKFEKFVANLAEAFGDKATIILIGSRARRTAKTYSDFDLLIIYKDLKEEEVYAVVRNFKSMDLPIDFLPIRIEDFNPNDKLLKEMLKEMRILHDGIKLFYENKL